MSTTNDFTSLNSIMKEAYADKIKDLIPEGNVLLNMIKFQSADKQPKLTGLNRG
jgi:hypothetical protein